MNSKQQSSAITKESVSRPSQKNDFPRCSHSLARGGAAVGNNQAYNESAAITGTTAIVSIVLTAFTLFALYTGLQNNVSVVTSQQQSIRVQIQLCLLLPLVVVYFTKVALEDYLRTLFSFNLSTSKTGYRDTSKQDHFHEEEETKFASNKKKGTNKATCSTTTK